MTVENTSLTDGPYEGNDVNTSFTVNSKVFLSSDLAVIYTNSAGVESTLVLDSDYSVSLNANQDTNPGGTVTYPLSGSPLTTGEYITVVNQLAFSQATDLINGGAYSADNLESMTDRAVMLARRAYDSAQRGLRIPVSDAVVELTLPTKTARSGRFLAFDADGSPFAADAVTGAAVSAFAETLLDDATADAFWTTLMAAITKATARGSLGAGGVHVATSRPAAAALTAGDVFIDSDYAANTWAIYRIVDPATAGLDAFEGTYDTANGIYMAANGVMFAAITPALDVDVTLTTAQGLCKYLVIATGAWTADHAIIVPGAQREYGVINNGAYAPTVKTAVGTGVVVYAGTSRILVCDGTNVVDPETGLVTTAELTAVEQGGTLVQGTPIATTSGTYKDYLSIPSWAKVLHVTVDGLSTNGTSIPMVQLGTASGPENSGYVGAVTSIYGATAGSANFSSGFLLDMAWTTLNLKYGTITLIKHDATNTWMVGGSLGNSDSARVSHYGGSKIMSAGALDRVRLTTVGGTDTFVTGSFNVTWG